MHVYILLNFVPLKLIPNPTIGHMTLLFYKKLQTIPLICDNNYIMKKSLFNKTRGHFNPNQEINNAKGMFCKKVSGPIALPFYLRKATLRNSCDVAREQYTSVATAEKGGDISLSALTRVRESDSITKS